MGSINQDLSVNDKQRPLRRSRNLEVYSVVIFSQTLASSVDFEIKLKNVVDDITIVDTQDDVKDYIKQNDSDFIILIISIEFCDAIIKYTYDLKQLYQIYIYNSTNTISQWTTDYKKVGH